MSETVTDLQILVDGIVNEAITESVRHDRSEREAITALREKVRTRAPLLPAGQVQTVVDRVESQLFGFGLVDELLSDPEVTEIMINGPGPIWIERRGHLTATQKTLDRAGIELLIERIVAPLGLRADRLSPMVDARLRDGARVNAVLPPLAIDGPYVTIRRFRASPFVLDDFAEPWASALLHQAVSARLNIIVSGGTGAGKTSLLNALTAAIAPGERVVTIEDAAELRLAGNHVVRLEARPGNTEGRGEVTIRQLVRNALRMRPDRIIVGEVRGAEALDMLQAMSTGHNGSLSTCHATTPADAFRRLETMVMMAGFDLPLTAIRDYLHSALDLVVQVQRGPNGARRVTEICAVTEQGLEPVATTADSTTGTR